MKCPYCLCPVSPGAPACTSCHLSFPKTCDLFGALPRLQHEVHDSSRLLSTSQQKSIRREILRLRNKYPQLYIQVVIHPFPPPHSMRTWIFWMFNAAAFSGEMLRGPLNHTLLIAIDPDRSEASLMPGYGLEPLLAPPILSSLLETAAPFFAQANFSNGILCLLDRLDTRLEDLTEPATHGQLAPEEF